MPRLTGFIGPSSKVASVVAASDQTFNFIPAKIESGTGAAPYVFDPSPGFNLVVDTGHGACQGSLELNRTAYFALGGELVTVDPQAISFTDLTAIAGTGNDVSIASNGDGGHQIMMARTNILAGNGTLSWYNLVTTASGTISTVTGDVVAFLDGYFIALDILTSTIFVSALNDGTSWDPLDFAQRNDFPDKWRTMIVKSTELWLFGNETISIYFNDGGADFPFAPNRNIAIQRGINAPRSLKLLQGSPIWLADDLTVRYAQGYTPVRVSTHAAEFAFAQYATPADADGSVYNIQGHSFYVLTFPASGDFIGASWCYDLTSGLWHQVGTYDAESDDFGQWPARDPINTGFQIVGSRTNGKIFFLQESHSTEMDGTTIITRRRTAPVIVDELKRIVHHYLILFAEVGNSSTAGTLTLAFSDDGGQTFTTHSTISAGTLNNFDTRLLFRKLGLARNRVYRITGNNITSPRWVDAFINSVPGAS